MLELVELKWKGVTNANISIAPKQSRYLDAFHIFFSKPNLAYFGLNPFIVDWTGYINEYSIQKRGDYEVDYVVFSDNFSPSRAKFRLHIGSRIDDIEFKMVNQQSASE